MQTTNPNLLNELTDEYRPNKNVKEYKHRPTVRVFVFDENNNIGLIKPNVGEMYFPPGGGVELGEDLQDAVKREVSEELGVVCEYKKDLGIFEHYHEERMTHFIIHHIYAVSNKEETKIDYEEYDTNLERVWMNIDEYVEMLDDYLKNKKPDDVWAKAVFYFVSKLVLGMSGESERCH